MLFCFRSLAFLRGRGVVKQCVILQYVSMAAAEVATIVQVLLLLYNTVLVPGTCTVRTSSTILTDNPY
jgi:hypothetical protein